MAEEMPASVSTTMALMGARRPLERLDAGAESVAVFDTGRVLVVAGGPIAASEDDVIRAAAARRRKVVFFGVAPRAAGDVPIGQEPVWSLAAWPDTVAQSRTLRSQVRRAEHKGVRIERLDGTTGDPAVTELVARWLRVRTLPPLGFVVDVESAPPHAAPGPHDLLLVARVETRTVGLLVARALPGQQEALIEHVLRDPSAPNGTGEALVDRAFRELATRGFTHATLGLAPLRDDPRAPLPRWLGRVRDLTRGLFDWRGLDTWKEKLKPSGWRPLVIRGAGVSPLRALVETLIAFAHGAPIGFALRTVLHGPPLFFRLVAALLVPWTVGLALIDDRHFPGAHVRGAWIALDVAITALLFWLAYRIKRRVQRITLHRLLAVVVSLDAAITLVEALAWNLPRARTPGDLVVMALGCLAPTGVAIVLWTSLRHRL